MTQQQMDNIKEAEEMEGIYNQCWKKDRFSYRD